MRKTCLMGNIDEQILRAAKEIVVKFIETGRISPSGFNETFKNIYRTIERTTKDSMRQSQEEESKKSENKDRPQKRHKK
jgi:hypothetical protein